MTSVWYIGGATSRTITAAEWAAAGVAGATTTTWNSANGWSIPRTSFTSQQLTILDADARFNTNAADGPRTGATVYSDPDRHVTVSEMNSVVSGERTANAATYASFAAYLADASEITVHYNPDTLSALVRHPWSPTRDLVMPVSLGGPNANGSARVRFAGITGYPSTYSVLKTAPTSDVWPTLKPAASGVAIDNADDNNPPLEVEGYYAGGNHGYSGGGYRVTAVGHGKTAADLGSQWTNNGGTFTLARIIDVDRLLFLVPYRDLSGGRSGLNPNVVPAVGTFTHASGATNTGGITSTSQIAMDLPEVTHSRTITAHLDGAPLQPGVSRGKVLTITESYTVNTYKGIVLWSQANVGQDPFTDANLKAAASNVARQSTTYRMTAGQLVARMSVQALGPFQLSMWPHQLSPMTLPVGGTRRQFMPGVGTVAGFDYRTYADVTNHETVDTFALAHQLQPADPPSRMVTWLHDSTGARVWGTRFGLLPLDEGTRAARKANGTDARGWWMSTFEKNYPVTVQTQVLAAGDVRTATAFRQWLHPDSPDHAVVNDGARMWVLIDTPDAHVTEQAASLTKAAGRTLVVDGTATVSPSSDQVRGGAITYTNTAPGYYLAEAVPDTSV